jgi:PAS domain S-box-containing protein
MLDTLLSSLSNDFLPQGNGYLWHPGLLWLHIFADLGSTVAELAVAACLLYLGRSRRDLPFAAVLTLLGAAIAVAGASHALALWTVWHPDYWLLEAVKTVAALLFGGVALETILGLPQALQLPDPGQLAQTNRTLERELHEARLACRDGDRLRQWWERSREAVISWTPDGAIVSLNPAARELLGLTEFEAIAGCSAFEVYPPIQRQQLESEVLPATIAAGVWSGETAVRSRGGDRQIPVAQTTIARRDDNGAIVEFSALLQNLSALKQAETALAQSERRFHDFVERAPDPIFLYDLDGRLRDLNARASATLGYSREQLLELAIDDLAPQAAVNRDLELWQQLEEDVPLAVETVYRRADGSTFPVELRLSRFDSGAESLVLAIARDISERQADASERERRSEEQAQLLAEIQPLRQGVEIARVAIAIVDRHLRPVYQNPAFTQLSNSNSQQLPISGNFTLLFADPTVRPQFRETLERGESYRAEIEIRSRDGRLVPTLLRADPIRDETGRVEGAIAFFTEIGDAGEPRQVLEAERRRLHAILDSLPALVYLQNADDRIQLANRRFKELFGEVEDRYCYQIIGCSDRPREDCPVTEVFQHQRSTTWECRSPETGQVFELHNTPFVDIDGSASVLTLGLEIGDRKRIERERDMFFTLSLDLLCVAGLSDGTFKRLNPAWTKVLGYEESELLDRPFIEFVHPDDRETTLAEAEKLASGDITINFENRYRCQDGSYRWLSWSAIASLEHETIYATARDITESKRTEAQLRQLTSEQERLLHEVKARQNALDRAALVSETDLAGRITFANSNFCQISGYSSAELLGKNHRIVNSGYHSQAFFEQMWQTIASGQVWKGEMCNRSKQGNLYWVDTTIAPIFNARGQVSKYVSIRFDITERKQVERDLEQLATQRKAESDALTQQVPTAR